MSSLSELEFLLVSNDYATLTAVSGGVKKYGGKLAVAPTADEAKEYLTRRRVDGIFVDTGVSGALEMIEAVRKGSSNAKAAVFACVAENKQSTAMLNAGANFLLKKPLSVDGVVLHITIAKDIMLREKRRYFRYPVNFAVKLRGGDTEQNGRAVNLSEGGMAVRVVKPLKYLGGVEFSFDPGAGEVQGEGIRGKGVVAWTSSEGLAGIFFHTLQGAGQAFLESWLVAREKLTGSGERAGAEA